MWRLAGAVASSPRFKATVWCVVTTAALVDSAGTAADESHHWISSANEPHRPSCGWNVDKRSTQAARRSWGRVAAAGVLHHPKSAHSAPTAPQNCLPENAINRACQLVCESEFGTLAG